MGHYRPSGLAPNTHLLVALAPLHTSPSHEGAISGPFPSHMGLGQVLGLISPHLPLLQLLQCPLFPPGCENPQQFSWWKTNGFTDIHSFSPPLG